KQLHVGRRAGICGKIGSWREQIRGPAIERNPDKEQPVLAVKQRERVRRMSWRENHFQFPTAKIKALAVMHVPGDLPGTGPIRIRLNARSQVPAAATPSQRIARVRLRPALGLGPRKAKVLDRPLAQSE